MEKLQTLVSQYYCSEVIRIDPHLFLRLLCLASPVLCGLSQQVLHLHDISRTFKKDLPFVKAEIKISIVDHTA